MQNIFHGLRPAIPSHVPKLIAKLIMKCWDARPNNRPASEEIYDILRIWINDISQDNSTEIVAQIKECEGTFNNISKSDGLTTAYYYKPYPEAKYTSKFIEYTIHQPVDALNYDKKNDVLGNFTLSSIIPILINVSYASLYIIYCKLKDDIQYVKEKSDGLIIPSHVERK
ncbi:15811_t:CDS:1 [Dentiscutata heterogama]|uniref:15811_t:CDS:1 n=1 Tax=Dentiscutata heterogama TaxID=1316150 RepID=A0ACA9LAZ7_9GLOM|nr:15811_t:CDS:1 [Dentiscutata heterogama]